MLHLISGYWVGQAIYAAAELGIADLLGKKGRPVGELARLTQSHEPSLYRLMRALASVGIFTEVAPGSFAQTPMGALLRSDMPGDLAAFSRFQGDAWHWQAWGAIAESVRSGMSAMTLMHGTPNCFQYLAVHERSAAIFNGAMGGYAAHVHAAVVDAYDFSNAGLIVDVGGGQGTLLAAILEAAPHASGLLVDRAEVLSGADAVLDHVAGRCATQAGDFFTGVPSGGDIYVLSTVLHDWNDADAITILRHIREAMQDNGRVLVVEHVVPAGNEPHPSKFIDLEMMLVTGGKERTAEEYEFLLASAGLFLGRIISTAVSASIIEAERTT
ncbi:MAG: methyltransferase [Betaproteobacteria bacterium]|nr:methyltransferase [Betaproteobacteria bacterium]